MNGSTAPISLPSFRELVNAAFKDRVSILKAMAFTLALAVVVAVLLPAKYQASSSLLVRPSSDYAPQEDAGSTSQIVNGGLAREEILPTEIEILSSPDLHAEVIRRVGLENLYPEMLEPPGMIHVFVHGVKEKINALEQAIDSDVKPLPPAPDPAIAAVPQFDDNLGLLAEREGSIIQVTFKHEDGEVAAKVVNTLIDAYLEHRRKLYENVQSTLIASQVEALRARLDDIADKTARFKLQHAVFDFATQQSLLLNQRDLLVKDLQDATNVINQLNAREPQLQKELDTTDLNVVQYADTDHDTRTNLLRGNLDTLIAQQATAEATFLPDSRPVMDLKRQIATIRAELNQERSDSTVSLQRVGRNSNYDLIALDLAHARSDLIAARARRETDLAQLDSVSRQLDNLSDSEAQLARFESQRQAVEYSYQDMVKQYHEHLEYEEVNRGQAANIRQISPAIPPLKPIELAPIILLAGLILSLVVGAISAFFLESRRPGLIGPEKLERQLGLTVLVSIPETSGLSTPSSAV